MSFERFLRQPIPHAEAAVFFIGLKKFGSAPAPTAASVMGELGALPREEQLEVLKEAGVSDQELAEVVKEAAQSGKERAHANLEAKHEMHRHSRGEQYGEIAGKALGAAGGFFGGAAAGRGDRTLTGLGAIGGGAAGAHIGGRVGKALGKEIDAASYKKHASAFKLALQEVDLEALAAEEAEGAQQQEVNEAAFYRQKVQQTQAELEAATQQALEAQQQVQQLQQQVAGNDQQMQASLQQAQMTQQGALANVQQAHMVATQATQQALQATDEALKNQQMAAAMRMALQEMRSNMMDVASRDPAPEVGAQLAGTGMDTPPAPGPSPEDPAAGGGPADQAAAPGAAPSAAPPEGEQAPAAPAQASAQPANPQPTTEIGIKESGVMERLPYAAAGAALGGGLTAIEAQRGHGDLRSKIQQLESAKGGGFGQALDLAKAKAMLAVGEVAEKHPVAATMTGSLVGAGLVGAGGPPIVEGGKKLFGRLAAQ